MRPTHRIRPALEQEQVAAEVLHDRSLEDVEREAMLLRALLGLLGDVAEFLRPAKSDETALLVQRELAFGQTNAFGLGHRPRLVCRIEEMEDEGRIERAGARAADETFERREPHARVDRPSIADRAHRRAAAEMGDDQTGLLGRLAEVLSDLARQSIRCPATHTVQDRRVRQPVKAVAP